jgi:guanosine-3',5'-bis(diphosphate) 3'-pyrophosphohydrolase
MMNLLKAIKFAAEKHATQRRKDAAKTPYINHPIEVAEHLARVGKVTDEDTLIAAILHDTIEDTDTTEEELPPTSATTSSASLRTHRRQIPPKSRAQTPPNRKRPPTKAPPPNK